MKMNFFSRLLLYKFASWMCTRMVSVSVVMFVCFFCLFLTLITFSLMAERADSARSALQVGKMFPSVMFSRISSCISSSLHPSAAF